jgi:bacillithiol system protein YtxJ
MRLITAAEQLDKLFVASQDSPVIVFKHSTQCPISSTALAEFKEFAQSTRGVACAIIHVIEDRAVSNAVAQRTRVRHESPQALVIKHGEVVWHASHSAITADSLRAAIA